MNRGVMLGTAHAGHDHKAADFLRQEIAFFESRLSDIGARDDGSYEQAMAMAYKVLLRERRRQLDALKSN